MPEYETVIVDISPTGKVMIKTEGFTGKSCLKATQELEASLGTVTKTTYTHETKPEQLQQNVVRRRQ